MSVEFVDTNVLIYAHDRSTGRKHEKAVDLLTRLFAERARAISIQVLIEFYSAATKKLKFTSAEAKKCWLTWQHGPFIVPVMMI